MGEGDYWRFRIQWKVGILEIPNDPNPPIIIPHFLILEGTTNTDTEYEGEYDRHNDTWTVYFTNAEFSLDENTVSGGSIRLWDGQLSFTIKIKRDLVES